MDALAPMCVTRPSTIACPRIWIPLSCTQEQAIQLIQEKHASEEKSLLKTFAEDAELQIRDGRFGPYMKYKGENYKLPKDVDPPKASPMRTA